MNFISNLFGYSSSSNNMSNSSNNKSNAEKKEQTQDKVAKQLSSWNVFGASKGADKLAAVVHTIATDPEERQSFFSDMCAGIVQGLSSSSEKKEESQESEESLVSTIFSGLKQISGAAVGEITGIALTKLLKRAKEYGLDEEDKDLLKDAQEDLAASQKRPDKKTVDLAKNQLNSLIEAISKIYPSEDLSALKKELLQKNLDSSSVNSIGKKLLELMKAIDETKNPVAIAWRKELNTLMRPIRSLSDTAHMIRKRLSKYHVIVGGFDVSLLLKWNEEGESKASINPISNLLTCQEAVTALKVKHELRAPVTPNETKATITTTQKNVSEELEAVKKTDKELAAFCEKLSRISTMKAVDYCVGKHRSEDDYKKILKFRKVRKEYAKTFSGIKAYFVQIPFFIIYRLITPIITKTLTKLVGDIRDFLKNNIDLLHFSEEKIKSLSNYLGLVERLREDWVIPGAKPAGTFSAFLELSIKQYEAKFTEEDLLTLFKKYIVENYTPRPNFSIGSFRVPLLTSFFEWSIWSIRKAIIKSYLKNTKVVETYLKEGTNSVKVAQLSFKKVLEKKLNQFKTMMDEGLKKRHRAVTQLDSKAEDSPQSRQAKKVANEGERIITPELHKVISEFSGKLTRFIDIEACNGDTQQLRQLDNRVDNLFQELIQALQPFLPVDTFSMTDTLRDACTNMTESAIESFFTANDSHVEEQLQSSIEILSGTFQYYESDQDRMSARRKEQEDLDKVDRNIKTLLQELSSGAVKEAVSQKLENVSGERHKRVKEFVDEEKRVGKATSEKLLACKAKLLGHLNRDPLSFSEMQTTIAQYVETLDQYLRHLSHILRSKELDECYSDVQKALFKSHQEILSLVSTPIINSLDTFATHNKSIASLDEIEALAKDFVETAESIIPTSSNADTEQTIKKLREIQVKLTEKNPTLDLLPSPQIDALAKLPTEIQELEKKIAIKTTMESKKKEVSAFITENQNIDSFVFDLNALASEIKSYKLIIPNRRYQTGSSITKEKESRQKLIFEKITGLNTQINGLGQSAKNILKPLTALNIDKITKVNDETINSLEKLLVPKLLFDKSLSSQLNALKQSNLVKTSILSFEILKLKKDLPNPDDIEKNKEAKIKQLTAIKNSIQETFQTLKTTNQAEKERLNQLMQNELSMLHKHSESIAHISKEPHVKGYITVGELQLQETLSPKIINVLVPQVQTKMETVVQALGKPFHWKQLVLRLVMTDIAKKQQEKA